jgi:hypothetical protein
VLFLAWPRDVFLDPASPEIVPDSYVAGAIPPSLISAPVRIPLAPLAAMLEASVPRSYGDLDERHSLPDRGNTEIAFRLWRAPFSVSLDGTRAAIRTAIRYGIRFYYDPPVLPEMSTSCGLDDGTEQPRLGVTLEAPVSVDPSWRLRTRTQVAGIRPASTMPRDRCTVTFLDLDVTDDIVGAARSFLDRHIRDIDSIAAAVDIRSTFAGWWQTLQQPVQLTDSLWLAMRPEAVQRGNVRGTGDSLEIALSLRARPTLVYGPRPNLTDIPLPRLDTGSVSQGLDLRVEAHAEYPAASAFLMDGLAGRTFEHEGRTIRLDSLRVFGIGGDRLAMELLLSGDVSARLYLVGRPDIDPASGEISVPDLDFDVATRDVVLAAASWLRADELREVLRERASWPAAPAVQWITGWLERGLNRSLSDELRVEGSVDSVRILGVHALREALLVQVAVTGSARLFVIDPEGG